MNRADLIRTIMNQPMVKSLKKDLSLPNVRAEIGAGAEGIADSLQERAVNRIMKDISSDPSPSLLNTMGEIAAKRGLENNPVQALDLARDLQKGGNVMSPQLLGLGAGEAVARAVAARPGAALATAGGTGAVGGLALITASGQALADLGNFLAGGQQNQGQRDNVLRS